MNGYQYTTERFLNDDDPISPQSLESPGPWAGISSAVSDTIDGVLSRGSVLPQASERSATLFQQLPPEVIGRVLWAADSNGFASLCMLNRTWYRKSQDVELYAYHLSRCPSYALSNNVITGPFRKNDLYRLKTKFAAEARRNLFDAYLRPRETHINLISISGNSSAAFPGGESFRFEFSPNGRTVLAISSSRIYVLDASSDSIEVTRELKTLRRPISASITDDASLLAVLSSKFQANIYALTPGNPVKHLQVIVLDNPPKTIALAHEGTVLAAAWQGGIEVFSLAANALSTDRRAVRSEAVDSLMFSGDGSMLVGSSQDLEEPNAVVVTASFYTENDPNITPREIHSRMWTTQILFPQISSTVSHAALLPGHMEGDTYWLFAYDHMLMTYRAVRTDDTRTGVAYFLSPPTAERFEFPRPNMAPVATACGTLAAAGFADEGLCLYGVPERLDVSPDMGSVVERHEERMQHRFAVGLTSATGHPEPLMAYSPSVSGSSEMIEDDGLAGKVDWRQSLFVKCKFISSIKDCDTLKWVENSDEQPCAFWGKRLIMTAPAGVNNFAEDLGEENMPVDGSRICLLDFDYKPSTQENREFTIEVGENEAELLTEQMGNIDIEVAMERRRTIRSSRGRGGAAVRATLGRSMTAASPPNPSRFEDVRRGNVVSHPSSPSEDALSPLTRSSGLSRSHTAAGFQYARFPPRPPLGSQFNDTSVYARGDPRRGSTDSWETPPPPYGADGLQVPHLGHRAHSLTPNLYPASVPGSSHSSTVNGNLSQLGVFQNRMPQRSSVGPAVQPLAQWGRRQNVTQSTTMDGIMTSEHGPSQRMMSQYGGLARGPRPENIPEESGENTTTCFHGRLPARDRNSYVQNSPMEIPGRVNGFFGDRRPQTHDGIPPEETLRLRATMTHPMSPPTPDRPGGWIEDQLALPTLPEIRQEHRLSLTGANLQNRLNHPVPPVPNIQSPVSPYTAGTAPSPRLQPSAVQSPCNQPPPQNSNLNMMPGSPSLDQMARLNRRSQPPLPSPLRLGYRSHTASRDFGAVPPSPPRAAWGAAGVPGSPSFNRAIATPNGLSRNNSRGSSPSIGASRSTPNLLLPNPMHSPRPSYNRLDTINSVNSAILPYETERSHSMSEAQMVYTRRSLTDPPLGEQKGKKSKKKKGEPNGAEIKRRGMKCIIM